MEATDTKRGPGRPKGSRNAPLIPPSTQPNADYHHPDPSAMVDRQLSIIDWAQQALRNEIQRGMQAGGRRIDREDVTKIEKLSSSLVQSMRALKQVSDLAEELSKRMTGAELLEAALKKIEGQDAATIRYAVKRLRSHLEVLRPAASPLATAADAIGELDED